MCSFSIEIQLVETQSFFELLYSSPKLCLSPTRTLLLNYALLTISKEKCSAAFSLSSPTIIHASPSICSPHPSPLSFSEICRFLCQRQKLRNLTDDSLFQYFAIILLLQVFDRMRMVSWLWRGSAQDQNQEELKKKGFDPQSLEVGVAKEQAITDFSKDYEGFISPTKQELQELLVKYKFFEDKEQHRHEFAYPKGGRVCGDKEQVTKTRAIGKQMIKTVGKKIISGDFNLTKISFPIKAMVPKSALEHYTFGSAMFPLFMTKAVESKNPLERLKCFMTATVSSFYYMNLFMKPLNPIIGQTLQGEYPDGSKLYCEQISHHPPIGYMLVYGPKQSYKFYAYSHYQAKAGLNSMTLINKGRRTVQFFDGQIIKSNFSKDMFSGVFLGTLRSEVLGQLQFVDEKNQIKSVLAFGKVKGKPTDYFSGTIIHKGKVVSQVYGSYMGFLEIDKQRWWDGRFMKPVKIQMQKQPIQSDASFRSDIQKLKQYKIQEAQVQKQRLEELQRQDAKLRKLRHK